MSDNIEPIEKNTPHLTVRALCLECKNKWIAVVPERANMFTLECPRCSEQNSFTSPCISYYEQFDLGAIDE